MAPGPGSGLRRGRSSAACRRRRRPARSVLGRRERNGTAGDGGHRRPSPSYRCCNRHPPGRLQRAPGAAPLLPRGPSAAPAPLALPGRPAPPSSPQHFAHRLQDHFAAQSGFGALGEDGPFTGEAAVIPDHGTAGGARRMGAERGAGLGAPRAGLSAARPGPAPPGAANGRGAGGGRAAAPPPLPARRGPRAGPRGRGRRRPGASSGRARQPAPPPAGPGGGQGPAARLGPVRWEGAHPRQGCG